MTTTRSTTVRELTIRSVVLGGLITLIFTAANVYLGLKVGLTFATAIPAAVISMAILRYFRGHSILENNIVQTIASAAGTLAAIIFVLPGLIMIGWWQGFPYWTTVAVCVIGGTLGVMYSVPLRRALVTGSDLPYPEGRRRGRGAQGRRALRRGRRGEPQEPARHPGRFAGRRRVLAARGPEGDQQRDRRRRSGSGRAAPPSGPACRWR